MLPQSEETEFLTGRYLAPGMFERGLVQDIGAVVDALVVTVMFKSCL